MNHYPRINWANMLGGRRRYTWDGAKCVEDSAGFFSEASECMDLGNSTKLVNKLQINVLKKIDRDILAHSTPNHSKIDDALRWIGEQTQAVEELETQMRVLFRKKQEFFNRSVAARKDLDARDSTIRENHTHHMLVYRGALNEVDQGQIAYNRAVRAKKAASKMGTPKAAFAVMQAERALNQLKRRAEELRQPVAAYEEYKKYTNSLHANGGQTQAMIDRLNSQRADLLNTIHAEAVDRLEKMSARIEDGTFRE